MKLGKNKDYVIYTGLFLSGWSLILLALLAWNYKFSQDTVQDIALYKMRLYFNEVLESRAWSALHGSVFTNNTQLDSTGGAYEFKKYTWPCEDNQRNETPGRTASAQEVVAVVMKTDLHVRVISRSGKNPNNLPDCWEKAALESFDRGRQEVFHLTADRRGRLLYRYIAPLEFDYSCTNCHQDEVYLFKKFSGGISIISPADPMLALLAADKRQHMFGFGFVWILGCVGIILAMRKLAAINEQRIRHEKFVGVMEMAGAAAHELNQPLQVISGCTEIMLASEHRLDGESKALSIRIKQSVDKLASITRKINRITRYVTTEYAGQTRIIDLEKAAPKLEDEVRK